MIETALQTLNQQQNLTAEQAAAVIVEITNGQVDEVLTAAYLAALGAKPYTVAEILGSAQAMRQQAEKFVVDEPVLDIVGTGGDFSGTFNVSTTSTFVLAAGGVKVVKHGGSAATSQSGAADVLQALGVTLSIDKARALFEATGQTFLYAKQFHPTMKAVAGLRQQLPMRTIFNLLGPLLNPARPDFMVLGVYDAALLPLIGAVVRDLGVKRALIVHSDDGLDELSVSAVNQIVEVRDGELTQLVIDPAEFGLRGTLADLRGGTPLENAAITRAILTGADQGAKRDAILLNAGAGFYVSGRVDSLQAGVDLAKNVIDSGAAARQLAEFIEVGA